MALKTYPTTVKDGKVYAEVTLRDVVEHNDVSDLPMLTEIKRLYSENDKLRKLCVKALEWLRWAGGITCPPEVPDEFADELRELGIEVGG